MTERPAGEVLYRNQGRVVVVTGASGGIGKAIALRFAAEGAKVAVVSRSESSCGGAAEEINRKCLARV